MSFVEFPIIRNMRKVTSKDFNSLVGWLNSRMKLSIRGKGVSFKQGPAGTQVVISGDAIGVGVGLTTRAKVQVTQTSFSTGIVSVKKLDSDNAETGDAFNAYAFTSKASVNLTNCRPLLVNTGTWNTVQVVKNIDGNWYITSPTCQLVTKITVQTDYQIDGSNEEFEKKTRANVEVLDADDESAWTVVHTGTEC